MGPKELSEKLLVSGMYVFAVRDAAALLAKPAAYASQLLGKSALFTRVERGRYCLSGKSDIFIVASHILHPSYVTARSAFRFYNLTTQVPATIWVASTLRHGALAFGGYSIVFRTVRKELMFGYNEVNGAFVASPEKAFLDSLYLERSAYLLGEEFDDALKRGKLDIDLLKRYAAKMGNRNLINILGFFLEERGIAAPELLALRSHAYVQARPGGGKRNSRWRVLA